MLPLMPEHVGERPRREADSASLKGSLSGSAAAVLVKVTAAVTKLFAKDRTNPWIKQRFPILPRGPLLPVVVEVHEASVSRRNLSQEFAQGIDWRFCLVLDRR